MLYSLVIDGVPGYPGPLPGRIRMPDGSTRTDLATWTDTELATIGYYPVTDIRPEYDPETERLAGPVMEFDGGVVTAKWTVEDLPEPEPETQVSRLAFRQRFTDAERVAIEEIIDPQSTDGRRFILRDFDKMVSIAEFIDLTRPDTVAGVQAMESMGVIGVGRAEEILTP